MPNPSMFRPVILRNARSRPAISPILPIFILALLLLGNSCKEKEPVYNFDKSAILADVVNGQVLPNQVHFMVETEALALAVAHFTQTLDSASLEEARAAWTTADLRWKACEILDIGLVMDRHLHSRIGKWPTDPGIIDGKIASGETMDATYFENLGATSRGLPAMEYLLFDAGIQATLAAYTFDSLALPRRAYLRGLADNLKAKAREVHEIWSADGEDYGSQLAASTATGIQDPMGLVVNAMIAMLEEVTKTKLGKPFGKFDLGILQPELVESFRANISLPLIRANMVALQAIYNGSSTTGLDQALDDLHARYGEAPLSTTITEAFLEAIQALDQITLPLQDAMIGQHAQVEAAYQSLKALVILFKADLCSAMNLTVTVSDADGD